MLDILDKTKMTHPWEKQPEPDYNEIPAFLKRKTPPNREEPKQKFPWGENQSRK